MTARSPRVPPATSSPPTWPPSPASTAPAAAASHPTAAAKRPAVPRAPAARRRAPRDVQHAVAERAIILGEAPIDLLARLLRALLLLAHALGLEHAAGQRLLQRLVLTLPPLHEHTCGRG